MIRFFITREMAAEEQQQQHPFLTSTHTIDEYKELQHKREFAALEHVQWLMETVAQTTHGYIFKRRRGHSYWLEEVKADAIIKRILNFNITVAHETTTTVGNSSTTKRTLKQYKAYTFITSEDHPALATYDCLEMFTRDPHRLSRYVPPMGPENDEWAAQVIDFMRSRVINPRAFDEEISSHAYRLRYPSSFIEKCFVHHCLHGNSGKSTLAWMLSLVYPKLANISVTHDQLTEKINGWTTDYMMIHVEELQGTEYVNKDFAAWIKRATLRSASVRKMYSDVTDGENNDGSITPAQALNLAKKSNVKIYTIGVGNDQSIMQSFFSSLSGMKVNRDNPELKALAAQTSGQYFRADSTESLLKVYEAIDALEAAENEDNFVKNITELYYIPLLAAILLAFLVLLWERLRK